jgi:hypothetical protein
MSKFGEIPEMQLFTNSRNLADGVSLSPSLSVALDLSSGTKLKVAKEYVLEILYWQWGLK